MEFKEQYDQDWNYFCLRINRNIMELKLKLIDGKDNPMQNDIFQSYRCEHIV